MGYPCEVYILTVRIAKWLPPSSLRKNESLEGLRTTHDFVDLWYSLSYTGVIEYIQ